MFTRAIVTLVKIYVKPRLEQLVLLRLNSFFDDLDILKPVKDALWKNVTCQKLKIVVRIQSPKVVTYLECGTAFTRNFAGEPLVLPKLSFAEDLFDVPKHHM